MCVFVFFFAFFLCVFFLQIRQHLKQKHTKTHMYILLYIIANPKTRMCFEVFKPPREYKYVFLPQALMSRKNKQGCPQLFISRAGVFDILLRCGNASNAGRCHFFVSKSNELFIYMLHDQVCADKSKRSFAHISTYKSKENDQVVKSSGTVSAKLVETNSYACAMFAVGAPN